jgi:hypothetical protein
MQAPPSLDSLAARILQLVKDRGVLRGSELLNRFNPDQAVIDAVHTLVRSELVNVKGDCFTRQALAEAYLTFRPSQSAIADYAIRSAS